MAVSKDKKKSVKKTTSEPAKKLASKKAKKPVSNRKAKSDLKRKLFKRRFNKFWERKNDTIYTWGFLAVLSAVLAVVVLSANWISEAEMNAVIDAKNLSIDGIFSSTLINFPFVLLQKISLWIFGITVFGIKLPSLIIAIVCLCVFNSIAKRWFSLFLANFASLIFATTAGFLITASSGTPNILYVFYPLAIIFLINQVSVRPHKSFWFALLLALVSAFAIYTPFMIYPVGLAMFALIWHPKTRFYIHTTEKKVYFLGALFAIIICAPIAVGSIFDINLAKTLFLPDWSGEIWSNFFNTMSNHVLMFRAGVVGASIAPMVNFAVFALMVLGIGQIIKNRYTFRSMLLALWLIAGVVGVWGNNEIISILIVPAGLTASWGLYYIITRWKRLFPENPYANTIGFIIVAFICSSIFFTDLDFFMKTTRSSPEFNQSISLALKTLDKADLPGGTNFIIDEDDENAEFWRMVADNRHLNAEEPEYKLFLTDGTPARKEGWKISEIITSTDKRTVFYLLAKPAE